MLARHDRAEGPGLHGGKEKGEKFLCCMTRYLLRMTDSAIWKGHDWFVVLDGGGCFRVHVPRWCFAAVFILTMSSRYYWDIINLWVDLIMHDTYPHGVARGALNG